MCVTSSRITLETTSGVVGVNLRVDLRCVFDPRWVSGSAGNSAGAAGPVCWRTESTSSCVLGGRRISLRSFRTWVTCACECILVPRGAGACAALPIGAAVALAEGALLGLGFFAMRSGRGEALGVASSCMAFGEAVPDWPSATAPSAESGVAPSASDA